MTTAIGHAGIPSRVGEIAQLLASRPGAKARVEQGSESQAGRAAADSLQGFDPFGASYQQALASASIQPGAAAAGDGVASAIGSSSSGASVSSLLSSFGGNVAVRRVASASGIGRTSSRSSVGQVGGYGAMPVPADLAAYGNGNIPTAALEPIGQDGHRLWAPAAESYKQLVAAAKTDGIDLTVTDSYRTYDQQVELADRKGLYADGGLAAVPGTSNHGWGVAVDFNVNSPAALEWLKNNGHTYGFVEAVTREPWHWEFRPDQA